MTTPKHFHPTVLVEHGDLSAEIDEQIAPLILETWKAGIETACSCQDASVFPHAERWMRKRVFIAFPSDDHAKLWIELVAPHETGGRSLYHRAMDTGRRSASRWHYDIYLYDAAYDAERDQVHGRTNLQFYVSLFIPPRDVALAVERLKQHNAGHRSKRRTPHQRASRRTR